ncbi:protein DEFECTIVE IN EXINE FORMATION 1 [Lingula anatina]|uniref:Protein DEFECTIVE IN EXINE FORMATION 1 n=1 Tax=Lingula anatina TaxID=7574 RepID=A0A1S3HNR0_LINAN|nr:protein DEFECTIVE IN EXINE FORMATION 1 [Lingula anatina]|eukprot:XP_013387693.1 protein DEFECTIVE IN EXINE FORMATION 1 [Lingula anatina]
MISVLLVTLLLVHVDYGRGNEKSCEFRVQVLNSVEVANSPFVSPPIITDVNGDGHNDIVASAFTEAITVIDGKTGQVLGDSQWPFALKESSVHSSPLQYDIDGDGMLDILIVTSDGEFKFFQHNGVHLIDRDYKLPPVGVKRHWYKENISVDHNEVHKYVLDYEELMSGKDYKDYVSVDPHVLATPVIADLDQDGNMEELVIPVSYFFDQEEYLDSQSLDKLGLNRTELREYLVGGLVLFNMTSQRVMKTVLLELTPMYSEFPAYMLFSPTVLDLDSEGGKLEIVFGTSVGSLYALTHTGETRTGFPLTMDSIHGQITVEDVNLDGKLEMIAVDTSANVVCYSSLGKQLWEVQISGTSSAGSRVADVDGNGRLDVVVATNDGKIYVLEGESGTLLEGWPIKVADKLTANPVFTKFAESQNHVDMLIMSDDGMLQILSGDRSCQQSLHLGEKSLIQVVSGNPDREKTDLNYVVSTTDGALVFLNITKAGHAGVQHVGFEKQMMRTWPSETLSGNGFTFREQALNVFLSEETRDLQEYSGNSLSITFHIIGGQRYRGDFNVRVYFGSHYWFEQSFTKEGFYTIDVPTPRMPCLSHVTVQVTNKHGQIAIDSTVIRFHQMYLTDIQWLLFSPFAATMVILLFLYGYPSTDVLPLTTGGDKSS